MLLLSMLFLCACSDPCKDVVCENGGRCDEGACWCEEGYMGLSCELERRSIFLGNWSGNYSCDVEPGPFMDTLEITENENNVLGVIISLPSFEIRGFLNADNELIINDQTVNQNNVIVFVDGIVEIINDKLFIVLQIANFDSEGYECSYTFERE